MKTLAIPLLVLPLSFVLVLVQDLSIAESFAFVVGLLNHMVAH